MSIITTIASFYPDFDTDKRDHYINVVWAEVRSFTNNSSLVEGSETDVDVIVTNAVLRLIEADEKGTQIIKSRSIEGFSESFIETSKENLNHSDRLTLANFYQFHSDFTN